MGKDLASLQKENLVSRTKYTKIPLIFLERGLPRSYPLQLAVLFPEATPYTPH